MSIAEAYRQWAVLHNTQNFAKLLIKPFSNNLQLFWPSLKIYNDNYMGDQLCGKKILNNHWISWVQILKGLIRLLKGLKFSLVNTETTVKIIWSSVINYWSKFDETSQRRTWFRFLRPISRLQSGQRSESCLSNNSKTTEANLTKLHRKIEHNEKVCRAQEFGFYAQGQDHNRVRGQIVPKIVLLINYWSKFDETSQKDKA